MAEPTDIGMRIRFYREKRGLNKAKLAAEIGVSDVTVSYWERGDIKQIGHKRLILLANALKVSIDVLMGQDLINEPTLSDSKKQRLNEIFEKIGSRYRESEALYLQESDVALLVENTSLASLMTIE